MTRIEQKPQIKISRTPTREYVYPGAVNTLGILLQDGHHVVIWTNEYFEHVASSRLGSLRKNLPPKEKKRLSVITATATHDKLAALPDLFEQAEKKHCSSIVIVDNTQEKLDRAAEIIWENNLAIPHTFVWVNDTLPFQAISPHSLEQEQSLVSIPNLHHITSLDHTDNTLFLIDFNETIIDTKRWEQDFGVENRFRGYL